jgi:hypothetical protein
MVAQVGYSVAGRSRGRVTPCAVCTWHVETRSTGSLAVAIEIKDLKHKLDLSSRYTVLSPPCETCVSLKGKFFYAIKENFELQ